MKKRFAFYTHDTFGLGHVRRCLHMIRKLSALHPESAILLVTGSPALKILSDLPPNVDVVKIPTVVKTGASGSLPSHLPLGLPEMTHIRSRIIRETILSFSPDLFMVDNFPLGAQQELLPLLHDLKDLHTQTILGLRDIVDGPEAIQNEWKRLGIYDILNRYYNKILIYGLKEIFDPVTAYDLPPEIADKLIFTGYLTGTDPVNRTKEEVWEELGTDGPFILATGGGGGDAYPLLSTFMKAFKEFPNRKAVLFNGPLMGDADRNHLSEERGTTENIMIQQFTDDLRPYLKAADLVVSMCGYNMASEIVFHGARAVVAPRTWRFGEHKKRKVTSEEQEQILRAEALAEKGYVHLLRPEELSPEELANKMKLALNGPHPSELSHSINTNGLDTAVEQILNLVGSCNE